MSRRAVLVVVALAVAALSTALLTVYVRGADDRAAQGSDLRQVLVATQEIPVGTTGQAVLDEGYVVLEAVPQSAVVDGSMSEIPEDLLALRLEARLLPGEQVLAQRFEQTTATRLSIPDGLMAVSIGLDDAARVAGNVEPSSEVAVFVTLAGDGTGATQLLLQRVTVLDTGTVDGSEGGGPLLTLAVDQTDAQKLIYAQTNGELYVALLDPESAVGGAIPPTDAGNLTPVG